MISMYNLNKNKQKFTSWCILKHMKNNSKILRFSNHQYIIKLTIVDLEAQQLQKKYKMSEKLALPKHLLRSQNLYDIFHFYSKLIYTHGVNNDFDRINYESNVLTMGKFFIFCRQFGIIEENRHIDFIRNKNLKNVSESLEKEKQVDSSKADKFSHKWWQNQQYQNQHENFIKSIQDVQAMDFNKLTKKELEEIFKKNTSNFKEMNYQEFQNVLPIIAKLMYQNKISNSTPDEAFEKFKNQILLLDQKNYRQRLKELHQAFFCYEKEGFRLLPGQNQKKKPIPLNINKEELSRWQNEKIQKVKEQMEQDKLLNNQSRSINVSSNLRGGSLQNLQYLSSANLKREQQKSQITWDQLEKMDYKDLGGLNEDNFKPDELFEDIGDDEYIKGKRKDEEKESKKAGRYDNQDDFGNLQLIKLRSKDKLTAKYQQRVLEVEKMSRLEELKSLKKLQRQVLK